MSAAWCGVAVLVSSFFRMPMVALLTTFAVYFGLWLVWVIGQATEVEALLYLYPNYYDKLLLSPQLWTAAAGFGWDGRTCRPRLKPRAKVETPLRGSEGRSTYPQAGKW